MDPPIRGVAGSLAPEANAQLRRHSDLRGIRGGRRGGDATDRRGPIHSGDLGTRCCAPYTSGRAARRRRHDLRARPRRRSRPVEAQRQADRPTGGGLGVAHEWNRRLADRVLHRRRDGLPVLVHRNHERSQPAGQYGRVGGWGGRHRRLLHGHQFSSGGRCRNGGSGVCVRGGIGGLPRPQLSPGSHLHGGQRVALRWPVARRPRALARAWAVPEPFCRRRRTCDRTRGADPRHDLRDRNAPAGRPADFGGREGSHITRARRARDFRGAGRLARVGTRGRGRADRPERSVP